MKESEIVPLDALARRLYDGVKQDALSRQIEELDRQVKFSTSPELVSMGRSMEIVGLWNRGERSRPAGILTYLPG